MNSRQLYEDDFFAWSEHQAAVLRRMGEMPSRLPNDLDIEHVVEEIEDLGRSERQAAESAIRLILVHLIKLAVAPTALTTRHWRKEIVSFQIELLARLTPSMAGRIEIDRVWRLAKREARASVDEEDGGTETALGIWALARCPLDLATLADDDIDIDRAVDRLRADP